MPNVNPKEMLFCLLRDAILRRKPDGVVLSGGIDSSLIAALTPKGMIRLGVTAAFEGSEAHDRAYSKMVADRLGIRHAIVEYGMDEAAGAAREIVRLLRTFDHVEIRNDITIYIAMKFCRDEGIGCVMTGDGGDELFAGYDYMLKMRERDLIDYTDSLIDKWSFSSSRLGTHLGIEVSQPYLDPGVIEFARQLPYEWKVRRSGKVLGKWILRSLLEELGFPEIACRSKEPIELGSGSESISRLLNEPWETRLMILSPSPRRRGTVLEQRTGLLLQNIQGDLWQSAAGIDPRPSLRLLRRCPGFEKDGLQLLRV